ncbi:adenylate kinase [Bienertia sinuspersici]
MAAIIRHVNPSKLSSIPSLWKTITSTTTSSSPSLSPSSNLRSKSIQWVFLGCPGVGKGTYASRLSNLLGVPHIATGDLVRHELSSNGPLSHQLKL